MMVEVCIQAGEVLVTDAV